jgi:uncharacterized protein DUF4307
MDPAILADRYDNIRRRGPLVSETRATAAMFPPGRYGRRRDGRRHLLGPIIFALVVGVIAVTLSVRLYDQYGNPAYDAQIVRWTGITDTQVTVDFKVRVPPGDSATCRLRARAFDGTEVGTRTVTVHPADDRATTIDASEIVTTTAKASVGEVLRCQSAA